MRTHLPCKHSAARKLPKFSSLRALGCGNESEPNAVSSLKAALRQTCSFALAACAAACLNLSAIDSIQARPLATQLRDPFLLARAAEATAEASANTSDGDVSNAESQYSSLLARKAHHPPSLLPTAGEADALLDLDRDMFTPDAWLGMQRLASYGKFVASLEDREAEPSCAMCEPNRLILEKAWQVVASEFYDPHGVFSQADWAGRLQDTLRRHGGVLRTKGELHGAAREMIESLKDPYSDFMEPPKFRAAIRRPSKKELDYLAAQAVGVGIRVGTVAEGAQGRVVTASMSGSSSEAAGVAPGDVLLSVEGVPAASLPPAELHRMFRGPVGSSIEVVVKHPWEVGTPKGIEKLELVYQRIPQPSAVHTAVTDPSAPGRAVEYVRINHFSGDTAALVLEAITEGELLGVDGFVIDLRNNPGGVFEEAISIASYFLDGVDTPIVQTVRYTEPLHHRDVIDNAYAVGALSRETFPRSAWGLTTRPLVVLVNSGTASASEVLAGALQDNQRAVIIGEQTFGKGVIQYFFRMTDGSGIKLTVAKYLTPSHHDISREGGLQPDMACRDHPRGLVPEGRPDGCILQAMQYVAAHPLGMGSADLLPRPPGTL